MGFLTLAKPRICLRNSPQLLTVKPTIRCLMPQAFHYHTNPRQMAPVLDVDAKSLDFLATMMGPSVAYQEDISKMPIHVSTKVPYKKNQKPADSILQAQKAVQSENWIVSENPRMIGNQAGFDLFEKIDTINKEINTLKKDNYKLQEGYDSQLFNRIIGLVNHSGQSQDFREAREARNQIVHGADIKFDLKSLEWARGKAKDLLGAAINGFESQYGLSLSECDSFIRTASDEIIQIVNKRSNLYHLHLYLHSSHHKKEIEMKKTCTESLPN